MLWKQNILVKKILAKNPDAVKLVKGMLTA
jgi:hypothetical protein